ncbi:hypothetical protein B0H13DRAFT_2307824 [Mycena leptocephala]|nr:hypothetical protein B0H13DRAFT_2307824 [Mycena leptocephala]
MRLGTARLSLRRLIAAKADPKPVLAFKNSHRNDSLIHPSIGIRNLLLRVVPHGALDFFTARTADVKVAVENSQRDVEIDKAHPSSPFTNPTPMTYASYRTRAMVCRKRDAKQYPPLWSEAVLFRAFTQLPEHPHVSGRKWDAKQYPPLGSEVASGMRNNIHPSGRKRYCFEHTHSPEHPHLSGRKQDAGQYPLLGSEAVATTAAAGDNEVMITSPVKSRLHQCEPWTLEQLVYKRATALGAAIDTSSPRPTASTPFYMCHHIRPDPVDSYLSGICNQLEAHFPQIREIRNGMIASRTL